MKIRQEVIKRLNKEFKGFYYHLICVAITGSHAYGMQNKNSDIDIMGIFLPPLEYLLGLKKVDQIVFERKKGDPFDGQLFTFTKWFKLLIDQNPNVLELLWHEPNQYVYKDNMFWPKIIEKRKRFLSKKLKHTFGGYAFAQLNRLDKLNEKVNQNKDRLEEFKKFGYSTKNASHMFRLLNMCFDALVDEEVTVMRPERQFLISIREGKYTYDEVVRMANDKFAKIEEAYMRSKLQNKIDFNFANEFHVEIMKQCMYYYSYIKVK